MVFNEELIYMFAKCYVVGTRTHVDSDHKPRLVVPTYAQQTNSTVWTQTYCVVICTAKTMEMKASAY